MIHPSRLAQLVVVALFIATWCVGCGRSALFDGERGLDSGSGAVDGGFVPDGGRPPDGDVFPDGGEPPDGDVFPDGGELPDGDLPDGLELPDGFVPPDVGPFDGGPSDGGGPLPRCGNRFVDPGEQCDDGNRSAGDGCDPFCRREPPPFGCGNRRLDPGEECDDGNLIGGDGCSSFCRIEREPPRCGNGLLELGEECDDGNTMPGDGCDAMCQREMIMPGCGDGRLDVGEECDDGNTTSGDGCDERCFLEPVAVCGDGEVGVGETCDDGNVRSGDGCSSECLLETCRPDIVLGTLPLATPVTRSAMVSAANDSQIGCGTANDVVISFATSVPADLAIRVVQSGDHLIGVFRENATTCTGPVVGCFDPGGLTSWSTTMMAFAPGRYVLVIEAAAVGSAGSATVTLELLGEIATCGNGDPDPGEICDDGNTMSGDGCSADCLSDETCGNGVLDAAVGEACDDGNTRPGDGCSSTCESDETCGNGALDLGAGEVCDDGNRRGGDGCSADCLSDETCGNGVIDAVRGEACDDGNTMPSDGCSPMCRREAGICLVDEPLGLLTPGVPVVRRIDLRSEGDEWETGCAPDGPEYVFTFDMGRTSNIRVFMEQMGHHNLGLYTSSSISEFCVAEEGICATPSAGRPTGIRFLNRPAGRYYLVIEAVGSGGAGIVDLDLSLDGCAPEPDLGSLRRGTTVTGMVDTRGGTNLYRAGCAGMSGRERVLAFRLEEMANVELAWNQTGDHVFSITEERGGTCDEFPVSCHDPTGAATGTTVVNRLRPGTYLVLVDAHDPGNEGTAEVRLTAR